MRMNSLGLTRYPLSLIHICIAKGCGLEVVDVNRLLKQFEAMQQMLKQFNRGRLPGMRGGFRRKRR